MTGTNGTTRRAPFVKSVRDTVKQFAGDLDSVRDLLRDFGREYSASYKSGEVTRYRQPPPGTHPMGSGHDYHVKQTTEWLRAMERHRMFARDDIVVAQGIRRVTDFVLNKPLRDEPRTGDDELDATLKAYDEEWSNDPRAVDVSGRYDFSIGQKLTFSQSLVDGDHFALLLPDVRLQYVEAHRCRSPNDARLNVVHGVELSPVREEMAYWFTNDDVGLANVSMAGTRFTRYPALDGDGNPQVLHVMRPIRTSQTRGASVLAPGCDAAQMHDDIQWARGIQQKLASMLGLVESFVAGDAEASITAPGTAFGSEATSTARDGSTTIRQQDIDGPIFKVDLLRGKKLDFMTADVPNPEFKPYALLLLTFIAINMDLPLIILLFDSSQTNWSSMRGVKEDARQSWEVWQDWLARSFIRPTWLWRVRNWIRQDAALRRLAGRVGVNVFKHDVRRGRWPYIDPDKDIKADVMRDEKNMSSKSRIYADRGIDWEDEVPQIVEDRALLVRTAKTKADEVNAQFGDDDPVSWRELAYGPGAAPSEDALVAADVAEEVADRQDRNGSESNT